MATGCLVQMSLLSGSSWESKNWIIRASIFIRHDVMFLIFTGYGAVALNKVEQKNTFDESQLFQIRGHDSEPEKGGALTPGRGWVSSSGGAEPEGEAFRLLLHLCSNPHLCSQIWVLTQRMRSWIQAAEMSFLQRRAGLSLRDGGRSSTIRREELHHPEGGAPPSRGRSSTIRGEELHHPGGGAPPSGQGSE